MGYSGQVFQIPCELGGLNHNKNLDAMKPESMVHPSRNLNLHENGRGKRGGTAHVNAFAFNGTPQIMGLHYYRLRDNNEFTVVAGKDGKIYKGTDGTTTLKTGMSTTNFFDFEVFNDELYIADGASLPQTWDGSAASTSDLTSPPTDWTGSNYPQVMFRHTRQLSQRMVACACPTTNQTVYLSENNDAKDFSDANVITLNIETGDGFGVVGGCTFGDRCIFFGKRQAFILDDTSGFTANWGIQKAQWEGGLANFRLLVKTPYDLIAMAEDGEIYSVVAAENYGDYKAASLTRASFMHNWIKEYLKLSAINQFHGLYDPKLRAIKFFVCRSGQTQNDTALVYFIDRGPENGWMVHDNQDNNSGYDASASALVRKSQGDWRIYTGDYAGNIWRLETANRNDNSAAYYGGFKTPRMHFNNPRATKNFKRGWLILETQGDYDVLVDWWYDTNTGTQRTVSQASTGGVLGSFTLGTDTLGGQEFIDSSFNLGVVAKRLQLEIFNSTVDEDFFVSNILIDHKPLTARPS